MSSPVHATCHCGAISITLAHAPDEVTHCNCSLCRSYGTTWVYCSDDEVDVPVDAATDSYSWNGRHVDFHRCRECGCVTHWVPRDAKRKRRGINANLLPVEVTQAARIRYVDGANR